MRVKTWRRIVLAAGVATLAVLGPVPAVEAAPVRDLAALPVGLQKYVPDSSAWRSAPWTSSPACRDAGGDFSVWVGNVLVDTPGLLAFFQARMFGAEVAEADRARRDAIIQGYRELGRELRSRVPAGYCVAELRRWAGSDPSMRPFGFPWGVTSGDGHQTSFYCTDREPDATFESEVNRWFGAERVPCDGFYVDCGNAQEVEKGRCAAWNAFSDSYVRRVERMRGQAIDDFPASATAETDFELRSPEEILREISGDWFLELTLTISQGAAKLLAEAMTFWTRADRSSMASSPVIVEVQGLLRYVGLALLAGGMIWQGIRMMVRRKLDPLISTGMGLLSYVGWSTLGGSLAILLTEAGAALSNQVLDESIDQFSRRLGVALQANLISAPATVLLLSLVVFFLSCVLWVLGFFQMGALVILLALISTAAAGQLTERTKPWQGKVLGWCLSLICYQPVAAIIFAIGFTLTGKGTDVATVLVGIAVLALAVISLPTMTRFFDWGGQQLVSSSTGGGGVMAAGAAASVLGGIGVGGFARMMDQGGPASAPPAALAAPTSAVQAGDGPGAGGPGGADAAIAPATTGPTVTAATGAAASASGPGATTGSATAATGAATGGAAATGAAATGGAAAAAGPVGIAVLAAQQTSQHVDRGVDAVAGAVAPGGPDGARR